MWHEIETLLSEERLPPTLMETIAILHEPLAERIATLAQRSTKPFVVGVCGAQGSGKSTLVRIVSILLESRNLKTAILSLDDLYLTRHEREDLAQRIHPLLRTRGVPGTHDVDLGLRVLDSLARGGATSLPRFDKSQDDRAPSEHWPSVTTPIDVLLFEGWCVGGIAQQPSELAAPINALERDRDPEGTWRRYVNDALASDYQRLFARIDLLVLLQAPGFDAVYGWRREQEHKLRERVTREGNPSQTMTDTALRDFIAHYERLTCHILAEMPARADIVIDLDERRVPKQL